MPISWTISSVIRIATWKCLRPPLIFLMVGMEPSDGVHIVEDVFDTLQATRVQAELNEQQANGLENGNAGNGQNRRPAFFRLINHDMN